MGQTVVVFDFETDGPDPETCRIVEIGALRYDIDDLSNPQTFETLVNNERDIPPEVSAVNHVTAADLVGKPTIAQVREEFGKFCHKSVLVAHNTLYDATIANRQMGFDLNKTNTLCTYRLAQHILPQSSKHSLQYLRYSLNLLLDGGREERAMAHTALADALVTTNLLEYFWSSFRKRYSDLSTDDAFTKLQELCWKTINVPTCPFRKHKGQPWEKVPSDYIRWCLGNIQGLDPDLKLTMENVLKSRN